MMDNRLVEKAVSMAALLAAVVCASAIAADVPSAEQGPPTTVRGIVISVDPPFGFTLEDGTRVELETGVQWDGVGSVEDLAPGDETTVVGRQQRGGGSAIKAGGVRVRLITIKNVMMTIGEILFSFNMVSSFSG